MNKRPTFPSGKPAEGLCVCCGQKACQDGVDLCDRCYYQDNCTSDQRNCER